VKKNKVVKIILCWLFVICFPILLGTTTIRCEVNSVRLYEYGFDKYDVSQTTKLDRAQLSEVARRLIDFFNSKLETPQVRVIDKGGEEFELFHDYELIHLNDVKKLFQLDYLVQEITFVYIIIYILLFFLWWKGRWQDLAKGIRRGCALALILIAIVGITSLFFFEQMFTQFHLIMFHNLYWLLDPSKDYLIMLFPEGFWVDAVYLGIVAIAIEALLLGGLAWVVPFVWRKRHSQ
jgi:integral membrane protein (TIGR01906 family)